MNPELAKDPKLWLDQMWDECNKGACAPAPPRFKNRLTVGSL